MPRTARRTPYPTEIAAYGGFDPNGNLALGTIRFRREDCAAEIERVAPAVEGFTPPLKVFPIFIGTDLNTQLDMLP